MRPRTDDEILEDLKDWPVRNIYVERGVKLIEQLRQRVAELINEVDHHKRWVAVITAERDKARHYCNIAEGRCDALIKQRNDLLSALENCRLLAARKRNEEWAGHVLRFCADAGVNGEVMRDA